MEKAHQACPYSKATRGNIDVKLSAKAEPGAVRRPGSGCARAADLRGARVGAPSDPGVVNYAVLGKGSVGNIIGGPMRSESVFTDPFQAYWVDIPVCNNWADVGLPEVYNDPDLASFERCDRPDVTHRRHPLRQAGGRSVRHHRRGCRRIPPRG